MSDIILIGAGRHPLTKELRRRNRHPRRTFYVGDLHIMSGKRFPVTVEFCRKHFDRLVAAIEEGNLLIHYKHDHFVDPEELRVLCFSALGSAERKNYEDQASTPGAAGNEAPGTPEAEPAALEPSTEPDPAPVEAAALEDAAADLVAEPEAEATGEVPPADPVPVVEEPVLEEAAPEAASPEPEAVEPAEPEPEAEPATEPEPVAEEPAAEPTEEPAEEPAPAAEEAPEPVEEPAQEPEELELQEPAAGEPAAPQLPANIDKMPKRELLELCAAYGVDASDMPSNKELVRRLRHKVEG